MKKHFFISGRQTYKTSKAVSEFLKSLKETLFISYCNYYLPNNLRDFRYKKNFISQHKNILEYTRGKHFKKIIIDEYFHFDIKNQIRLYKDIYELNKYYPIEELYIYSSPLKAINNTIFNIIKSTKPYNYDIFINVLALYLNNNSKIYLLKFFLEKIISSEEYYYLCNNFLIDNDMNIINDIIPNPGMFRMFPSVISSESEVFGKYLSNKSLYSKINKEIIKELINPRNENKLKNNSIF